MAKKKLTENEKFLLFDLENYKRKVRENPAKYDWRNHLIPLVEEARKEGKKTISLRNIDFYIADVWVLDSIGCSSELEFIAHGHWFEHIFLDEESRKKYLEEKDKEFIQCLCSVSHLIGSLIPI